MDAHNGALLRAKRSETVPCAARMDLEMIALSQKEKDKYQRKPLICGT